MIELVSAVAGCCACMMNQLVMLCHDEMPGTEVAVAAGCAKQVIELLSAWSSDGRLENAAACDEIAGDDACRWFGDLLNCDGLIGC